MLKVKCRIITLFTALLLIFSFILSPIHFSIPRVLAKEYLSPLEELQASEGFDEESLSTKTDITVIDFMEYWEDDSELPLYFVYVYNPTTKVLKNSTDNRIHIQTNNNSHWNSYNLSYVKATEDGKYVKYVLSESELLYNTHKDKLRRYYDVSEVKLMCDNNATPDTFTVGYKYLYTFENNESVCKKEIYEVMRVEELIPLVYRNIKSGVCEYPDGQINSVAFSISNDVIEKYGEVSEIHFEYWKYRTSPILVSDSQTSIHKDRARWLRRTIDSDGIDSSNPLCITWGRYDAIKSSSYYRYEYGYNRWALDMFGNPFVPAWKISNAYNKLCYSIYSDDVTAVEYDVTSETLADYIYSYASTYLSNQEYESIPIKDGKIPAELFEDPYNEKYGYNDKILKRDTLSYVEQSTPNRWEKLWGLQNSSGAVYETIMPVNAADLSLGSEIFASNYLFNESYVSTVKPFVQSANDNNETVYLLRFDVSDYYTSPVRIWGTYQGNLGGLGIDGVAYSSHAYVAQTDVFLNFTFIDFTFCKNGVATVLAVSSDVIDIFPSIQHPEVPDSFDWWYWIKLIISIVLIIFLVVLFWNPVISPLLKIVFGIIAFPFRLIFGSKDKPSKKNVKKFNRRRRK